MMKWPFQGQQKSPLPVSLAAGFPVWFCCYLVGWWRCIRTLALRCVVLAFFHFVAGLKEFYQTVDQFLAAANHVQAVFALMLVQYPGETFFQFHVSTLLSLLLL